ncbi:adenosine receptor A3-like [Paramacrobiotus metropolitanus]|uniref:adenosine receptor A3-like n=1 Tax=Paramacrobiotus metropolitanus TaxID=2943436 RepID=UPI0024456A41|nr:adenosine receptor A3-like [Paramacrobiotus metropolitanus]
MTFSYIGGLLTVFLFVALLQRQSSKSRSGFLIEHLLLVDFVICAIIQPTYLVNAFLDATVPGRQTLFHCIVFTTIRFTTYYTQYWAQLTLAVNRLIAVSFPKMYKTWTKRHLLISAIVFCWLVGIACNIPPFFGFGYTISNHFPPLNTCSTKPASRGNMVVMSSVGIYVPMVLVGVIYIFIWIHSKVMSRTSGRLALERRMKVAKMLFASFVFYLLLFLPMAIAPTFFPTIRYTRPEVLVWLNTLQALGFGSNSMIFLVLNDNYRKHFQLMMAKLRTKEKVAAINKALTEDAESPNSKDAGNGVTGKILPTAEPSRRN